MQERIRFFKSQLDARTMSVSQNIAVPSNCYNNLFKSCLSLPGVDSHHKLLHSVRNINMRYFNFRLSFTLFFEGSLFALVGKVDLVKKVAFSIENIVMTALFHFFLIM